MLGEELAVAKHFPQARRALYGGIETGQAQFTEKLTTTEINKIIIIYNTLYLLPDIYPAVRVRLQRMVSHPPAATRARAIAMFAPPVFYSLVNP